MKISIKFCMEWNYGPTAASLAEAIKESFGVDSKMIEGSGGVFDVHVNDTQIWDKHSVGRFPEHKEIIDKIKTVTSSI